MHHSAPLRSELGLGRVKTRRRRERLEYSSFRRVISVVDSHARLILAYLRNSILLFSEFRAFLHSRGHNPNPSLPCPLPPGADIWSGGATRLVKLTYVAQGRCPRAIAMR